MDQKILMDLAAQMGFSEETARTKANEYKGKSDDEILREIAKIKNVLKRDKRAYEKQLKTVKALAVTMNGEQRARLQKIIDLLES